MSEQTYQPDLITRYKKDGLKVITLNHTIGGALTIGFEDGSRIMVSPRLVVSPLRIEAEIKVECWNVGGLGSLTPEPR